MDVQNIAVNNIRFDPDHLTNLLGENHKYNQRATENAQDIIVVNGIHIKNCQECENTSRNKINGTNQNIPFCLKAWTCQANQHDSDYIFIEQTPYECSFGTYFCNNISPYFNSEGERNVRQKQEELNSVFNGIFELVRQLHLQKIVLKSFLFNNIRVCMKYDVPKPKFVNLTKAKISSDDKGFTADLNRIGQLLLSLFNDNKDFYKELDNKETYETKLEFINEKLNHIKCIEPYKLKLFGHLIFCLIELRTGDCTTIQYFKNHPFFWDEKGIEDFLRIINSRVDLYEKEKKKDKKIKDRINQLNEKVKYVNWKNKTDDIVQVFVPKPTIGDEHQCNDLLKFIRNKIIHKDDDTDIEDNCEQSTPKTCLLLPTTTKCKDGKILWEFFNKHDGPLNYFLETFKDLLYELFIHFQIMYKHKKIKQFYPKCFLEDINYFPMLGSRPNSYPHVNPGSKNTSLKNSSSKEESMKNTKKSRCSAYSSNVRN